jgi:4'-phosphopantetheinyl transferase
VTLLCLLAPEPDLLAGMAEPAGWLCVSERARMQGFGTPSRRDSFLAGRWLARLAVQRWRGGATLPVLEVAGSGACHVAGGSGPFVSISHSAGTVACVVGALPVGVDIEDSSRPRDHLAMARMVHSPAQCEQLAALPPAERARGFVRWWTGKEAWLKARERGLDFAAMRALEFDDDEAGQGDVAIADLGGLVLAVAVNPLLPGLPDGPPGAQWRRYWTRAGA